MLLRVGITLVFLWAVDLPGLTAEGCCGLSFGVDLKFFVVGVTDIADIDAAKGGVVVTVFVVESLVFVIWGVEGLISVPLYFCGESVMPVAFDGVDSRLSLLFLPRNFGVLDPIVM